ncbi:MAG: hypothetical protein ACHP65_04115 [Legionellales bacterium]
MLFGLEHRQIRIWHNNGSSSMTGWFKALTNYDGDSFITFKSQVSFKQFCDTFLSSGYNDAIQYRFLTHNCAHAAHFALTAAKINVPIGSIKWTQLIPSIYFNTPTPVLSPTVLYLAAKKYKTEEIKKSSMPFNSMPFKVQVASSSLSFWAKKTKNNAVETKANTILSEIQNHMKTRPHHTELYLEALIRTIDRINSSEDKDDYNHFCTQFKRRYQNPAIAVGETGIYWSMAAAMLPDVIAISSQTPATLEARLSWGLLIAGVFGYTFWLAHKRHQSCSHSPVDTKLSRELLALPNVIASSSDVVADDLLNAFVTSLN